MGSLHNQYTKLTVFLFQRCTNTRLAIPYHAESRMVGEVVLYACVKNITVLKRTSPNSVRCFSSVVFTMWVEIMLYK